MPGNPIYKVMISLKILLLIYKVIISLKI